MTAFSGGGKGSKMSSTASRGSGVKAETRPTELLALSRISAALSGLWDLDAILGVGLDSTLDIMDGTIGEILHIDENTQELSRFVHRGLSREFLENVRLSLGEGITGSVAQTGKAVLLEDISSDPRVAHRELVMAEGLKAFDIDWVDTGT